MYSLKLAFRSLFKKGQLSLIRIVSLATGLAFGILLLAEVFYNYSFDSFYPDAERIYCIHSNANLDKSTDEFEAYSRVSGAIAPGMKAEVPGVEAATRMNSIGSQVFYTTDKQRYKAKFSMADEHLFEVLPRPMLSGDAPQILKTPMACMVSNQIAEKMGGVVVGETIELKQYPGERLTIMGVFEALPENTNYQYDILVSMISLGNFTPDGSNNWLGNDRYYACVKLYPGVNPLDLAPAIRLMQEKHQDILKLEATEGGIFLKYSLEPITKMHSDDAKDMIIILCTIAFAVLFVSLMNYILLTLSSLVNRAKTSAIYKTCGAQSKDMQQLVFFESFVMFVLSLFGAAILIWSFKPMAEQQLGHQLAAIFNPKVVWPLLLVVATMIIVTSYFPARFFSRIPVTAAFRNYHQKRNKWKLALLAFQFVGASFIMALMVVVSLQYDKMINADHGYQSEGVYYASVKGMDGNKIPLLLSQLRAISGIEKVGFGTEVPITGQSGNNVIAPDGERELFNVADFYYIDENYLSILNIPIEQGNDFSSSNATMGDVLISKKGADMLVQNNHWNDGVLGKDLTITEHGTSSICGVFSDFIVGGMSDPDYRPAVFFYVPESKFKMALEADPTLDYLFMIKVDKKRQAGIITKIEQVLNTALPQNDALVMSLENNQMMTYRNEKGFRNSILAGNFIIVLLTIIGLVGYTTNEAIRRRKELAIRRINGAKLSDILSSFIIDLQLIAVPAIAIGSVGAWLTLVRWMQNFAAKVSLNWSLFLFCSLITLLFISLVAFINYVRLANRNPVEALRYE